MYLFMRITLLLIILTVSSLIYTPQAHAQGALKGRDVSGLLGAGAMSVGAFGLYGERLGASGGGGGLYFEYAGTDVETTLGAYMGAEILMYIGYESFDGEDPHEGEYTMGPLLIDLQMGFPTTFLTLGSDGIGSTAFTAGFGGGLSVQHVYGYLRARTLTRVGDASFVELRGTWIPSASSYDWSARTGLGIYQARVSFMTQVFEDKDDPSMHFFIDWSTGDRVRGDEEDPMHPAVAPATVRTPFESVWQGGVGFMF